MLAYARIVHLNIKYLSNCLKLNFRDIRDLKFLFENKTKSIGVSEANYSCIWFLNGGIINSD